jgi:DNA polymerase-3 subunit alpha
MTPIGESEVCQRFMKGQNLGVFQFGKSEGMLRLLRSMKPTEVDHLIAANAMYRPGPMQNADAFCKRKNNEQYWTLPHPKAERALGRTFGIITFQEQVMQLCISLAGFTPEQAYVARKVVAKGVVRLGEGREKLDKLRDDWMRGTAANGISPAVATQLWEDMLQMATYSFNRAHAAGYALQAYQDQWLKVHYPLEFYTAMLTWDPDKGAEAIREARSCAIEVLPPDINSSGEGFTLVGDTIRFGLLGIFNVGEVAAGKILELRPFTSLENFDAKIAEAKAKRQINAKVRTSLMDCGAFDQWGARDDLTPDERAESELRLIGFAPSRPSDLALYADFLAERCELTPLTEACDGDVVNFVGEVLSVNKIVNKKGYRMAFVKFWYEGVDFESVFWEDKLIQYESLLNEGETLLVRGKWQEDRQSLRVYDLVRLRDLATYAEGDANAS